MCKLALLYFQRHVILAKASRIKNEYFLFNRLLKIKYIFILINF